MTIFASKLEELAATFPALRDKPGQCPWDANILDEWASSGLPSHGEKVIAQFLLSIWDSNGGWKSGRFNVMEALRVFDETSHQAFLKWAAAPWWA